MYAFRIKLKPQRESLNDIKKLKYSRKFTKYVKACFYCVPDDFSVSFQQEEWTIIFRYKELGVYFYNYVKYLMQCGYTVNSFACLESNEQSA